MRIGIDIDGTLTNFEKFVANNSKKYMKKKYGLELTNPDGYDLDEMYELEKRFLERGISEEEARRKSKNILDKYWNKYFIKYLFTSFRPEVKDAIKALYYSGNQVEIFSSRKKTTQNSALGKFVRNSSLLSLRLHGIKVDKVNFFEDDESKIEAIKQARLHLLFDDKPEVIEKLRGQVDIVKINSNYNKNVQESDRISSIADFDKSGVIEATNKLLEKQSKKPIKSNFKPGKFEKIIKHLDNNQYNYKYTDRWYHVMRVIGKPFVWSAFKPIILNKENGAVQGPVVISPNHRSTLDPFFIIGSSKYPMHWAALKRFFDASDSIFNNNKNPFLCKLSTLLFRMNGSIPIERLIDNPKANNRDSIYQLTKLVRDSQNVGVFPEGTTNKEPEKSPIGNSEHGGSLAFTLLRVHPDAKLLPISIQWIKKGNIANKVIINYRKPILLEEVEEKVKVENGNFMDVAKEMWSERIIEGLNENQELINELDQQHQQSRGYVKKKVRFNRKYNFGKN